MRHTFLERLSSFPGTFLLLFLTACASTLPNPQQSPAEVADRRSSARAADIVPTAAQFESLKSHPRYATEPFVVANLLAFRGERGRQVYYGEYAPGTLELIRRHGGQVIWLGAVEQVLAEAAEESWDQMILVMWPSRSAFIAAFESPEYDQLRSARARGLSRTKMLITNPQDSRAASAARDSAETAAAIARLSGEWLRAYENGDADAVAALFTDDGIYAANTGQLLRGRDGIREGVRGWIAGRPQMLASLGVTNATGIEVREEIVRFRLAGDAAYRVSRFMIRVEPYGCFMDAGHGLAVWRLQDGGSWRLESLTVNRDSQAAEGACARR